MIEQHLRHCSAGEVAARQWIIAWQQQGFDVLQGLASGHPLLHFITDSGWEGVIDLAHWFSVRVPQSAGLASTSWTPEQLETLFVSCERPLTALPAELSYQRVESKGILPSTFTTHEMYACRTPQGRVWIRTFPTQPAQEGIAAELTACHLPLHVQFRLGHSLMSLSLLRQIQPGDVILVNDVKNIFISNGCELGGFIIMENGLMFHEEHDRMSADDEMALVPAAEEGDMPVQPLASRASVKVRLDVVLQQSTLSIAELESFYRGKVMPCSPDAQQNIVLAVNGVAIAKGELIWIEDRLGVEITDIYQEVGDVCR